MMLYDWYSVTVNALLNLWQGFLLFMPNLFGATIIFVLGLLVSALVGKWSAKLLEKLRFNKLFERESWRDAFNKANVKIKASEFVGQSLRWILTLVFLSASIEILGLYQFASFLTGILAYLNNVVIAALIFVVTVVVVDIVVKLIVTTGEGAKFTRTKMAGEMARWSIWVFAIMAIIHQLGVATRLVEILFTGIVMLVVIAGGLAFGLAGKDAANDVIRDIKERMRD
ncbi:MAG: hypothetical protein V1905_00525 [bacterium]